ncbi:Histone H2A.Z-specific chaperone CHZ1 [Ophidiomyces ophidiicola]|nr:Histone H2A.Z-specific chaperone CHZ1 [Ophidiomyces ophidiicola]KAI1941349.1 Histone H2A.Z-specific chaperone CHZ1 [Ophidiomyces ophidiicola]KAI1961114.1 Histone H2A.Z-specific chaperone CHZ1 [Ophidiomyces ophidiicola]
MSAENENPTQLEQAGSTAPDVTATASKGKGKAKAVEPEDAFMGQEAEDTDSEESEAGDDEVTLSPYWANAHAHSLDDIDEEEDHADDKLEPISASNIIEGGRRTRGKKIDYAQAAAKADEDETMEDDDDDDYYAPPREDAEEMRS